jgi:hypothetical protein
MRRYLSDRRSYFVAPERLRRLPKRLSLVAAEVAARARRRGLSTAGLEEGFVGYCSLVVARWLLLVGCCSLVVARWLLLVGCCSLVVARRLLLRLLGRTLWNGEDILLALLIVADGLLTLRARARAGSVLYHLSVYDRESGSGIKGGLLLIGKKILMFGCGRT